ncbi:hypothetical protein F0562_011745 [Nyssa sinensis]|uniref:Uncharacterized protein n=1 Tax=Nyssa sinensis TaxID=561372 RepID=A0A5J4ZUN3_9ASTE|nr:hypothetical protein F0562_011745 [Nyssa sinensis]
MLADGFQQPARFEQWSEENGFHKAGNRSALVAFAPDAPFLVAGMMAGWLMGFLWVQMDSSRGGSVVRFLRIWLGLLWRRKGKQQQRVLLCGACLRVLSGNGAAAVRRMAGRDFEKNLELIALNKDDVKRGDENWGSTEILTEEDTVLRDGVLAVGSACPVW